jgi:hypothetical protein
MLLFVQSLPRDEPRRATGNSTRSRIGTFDEEEVPVELVSVPTRPKCIRTRQERFSQREVLSRAPDDSLLPPSYSEAWSETLLNPPVPALTPGRQKKVESIAKRIG